MSSTRNPTTLHGVQFVQTTLYYTYSWLVLEGTARYAGFTSSSCGGLRPSAKAFLAFWAKKEVFMLFLSTLDRFWCSVITSVTFSRNISYFEIFLKNPKKIQKYLKISKKFQNKKNPKKIQKNWENFKNIYKKKKIIQKPKKNLKMSKKVQKIWKLKKKYIKKSKKKSYWKKKNAVLAAVHTYTTRLAF